MENFSPPTLYHRGKKGELRSWRVWTDGAEIRTEYGLVDGEKTTSSKIATSKNVGRSNETSAEAQARIEAEAMWTFKHERKYSMTPAEAMAPDLFPMLAIDIQKVKEVVFPLDVQPKLDGVRCLAYQRDDIVTLLSRGGKEYDIPHLKEALRGAIPEGYVLDGEIYCHGMTFQEVTTLVKKNRPDSTRLQFHAYDLAGDVDDDLGPLASWANRYIHLCDFFGGLTAAQAESIKLVSTYRIGTQHELDEAVSLFVANGYEGGIARHLDGPYLFGYRSRDLLKIKTFDSNEFQVTDVISGVGRFVGCAILECMSANGEFFVSAPGSIEAKQTLYNEFLASPEMIVGQLLVVKHFGRTDAGLPRFPVAVGFRDPRDL